MNQDPIIKKITTLLDEQGKTQKNLTDYLGITQNAFTDWKSGRIKSYQKHLSKIAEFLGVSVDYLLGKTEQKEKPSPEGESLEENVIIVHRDGKSVVRKYTKEQLDAIEAILNQIGDSES